MTSPSSKYIEPLFSLLCPPFQKIYLNVSTYWVSTGKQFWIFLTSFNFRINQAYFFTCEGSCLPGKQKLRSVKMYSFKDCHIHECKMQQFFRIWREVESVIKWHTLLSTHSFLNIYSWTWIRWIAVFISI